MTDAKIRAWLNKLPQPLEKPSRLVVGDGLFPLAKPPSKRRAAHGARCGAFWRFRYTFGHTKNKAGDVVRRESMIGLGAYPDVGLADAKGRRDEARRMLAESPPCDPAVHADWSQAGKRAAAKESVNTFQTVAEEWLAKQTLADCQ